MGRPSEQIRCDDWTAGYILDDAVLTYGKWVTDEVKRYANHVPSAPQGSKKKQEPPSEANVIEYERALIEGTEFRFIRPQRKLPVRKRERPRTNPK